MHYHVRDARPRAWARGSTDNAGAAGHVTTKYATWEEDVLASFDIKGKAAAPQQGEDGDDDTDTSSRCRDNTKKNNKKPRGRGDGCCDQASLVGPSEGEGLAP